MCICIYIYSITVLCMCISKSYILRVKYTVQQYYQLYIYIYSTAVLCINICAGRLAGGTARVSR